MTLSVCVIIPTRGRTHCVYETLSTFAIQDDLDFDLWLIDQNEVPLKLEQYSFPIYHEHMEPLGSHAGRNRAIYKTDKDICIFVDDDVLVPKNFISLHKQAFKRALEVNDNIGVVAGRVIQPKDNLTDLQMQQLSRRATYNAITGQVYGNFFGTTQEYVDHIHECNFAAQTKVLRLVGGFNERFAGNAYFEGTDLSLRILKSGYKIIFRPEVSLTHMQDSLGGNRVQEKSTHNYWYMRNLSLLNSLHLKKRYLPVFELYSILYILGKSAKNLDFRIATEGFKGLFEGLRFFLPSNRPKVINSQSTFLK
ncbi:MAG: glycosyltransferase family 2 protein [Bacteriovoracia bacterium]